jgi:hypothetical protein
MPSRLVQSGHNDDRKCPVTMKSGYRNTESAECHTGTHDSFRGQGPSNIVECSKQYDVSTSSDSIIKAVKYTTEEHAEMSLL